jgi:hypothetical protein
MAMSDAIVEAAGASLGYLNVAFIGSASRLLSIPQFLPTLLS